MKLSEIKTASLSDLYVAAGKTILSQGCGNNFSKMLENRLRKIEKEIKSRKKNF